MTGELFALPAYKLLKNGGDYAKALLDSYKAVLTKESYLALMDSMSTTEVKEMELLEVV